MEGKNNVGHRKDKNGTEQLREGEGTAWWVRVVWSPLTSSHRASLMDIFELANKRPSGFSLTAATTSLSLWGTKTIAIDCTLRKAGNCAWVRVKLHKCFGAIEQVSKYLSRTAKIMNNIDVLLCKGKVYTCVCSCECVLQVFVCEILNAVECVAFCVRACACKQ